LFAAAASITYRVPSPVSHSGRPARPIWDDPTDFERGSVDCSLAPSDPHKNARTAGGAQRITMTTIESGDRCVDALVVALNQAHDGQEKRWYVSTLELQLVSLELCEACRKAETLHVRVDQDAPPCLWSSRTSPTTRSQHGSDVCISSRVPAVWAFGWTWNLPMDR
ncbi:unnamed protein product, partial [Ectocarpus sp. 12 AP-2014]